MAIITERDKEILRFLSSGPATISQIYEHLKKTGKAASVNGSGKGFLYDRLSRLSKGKYVKSKIYANREGHGTEALYALDEYSKDVLVNMGYMVEMIRTTLPESYFVTHELAVTAVVRKLKRESYSEGYELSFKDENTLKAEAKSLKNRKRKSYPDLLVRARKKDVLKEFAIEIDNGTIPVNDVVKKLKDSKTVTIVLCMEQKRINALRAGFAAQEIYDIPVCFGFLADFYKTGIFGTEFTSVGGAMVAITWKQKTNQ